MHLHNRLTGMVFPHSTICAGRKVSGVPFLLSLLSGKLDPSDPPFEITSFALK